MKKSLAAIALLSLFPLFCFADGVGNSTLQSVASGDLPLIRQTMNLALIGGQVSCVDSNGETLYSNDVYWFLHDPVGDAQRAFSGTQNGMPVIRFEKDYTAYSDYVDFHGGPAEIDSRTVVTITLSADRSAIKGIESEKSWSGTETVTTTDTTDLLHPKQTSADQKFSGHAHATCKVKN